MTMQIFNTLSGKKEKLQAPKSRPLRLFVCGPTVYDETHIGHARTYLFFDFFAKYLRSQGVKLFYLQNITDIDDKIIRRAEEEKKKPLALSRDLAKGYLKEMKILGVTAVNKYAYATKFVPQIIAQVERLIKKGFAYKIGNDGWYFDVAKFPGYGKLSRRTMEQAEDAVSRIDASLGKRNKGDFCLWKFSKPGEPVWKSPSLGDGRPGWHIEDTAISEHYFGPQYDLHGGGLDIKFPHHEAEIAQQEAASGKSPFVKIWLHTGMLTVNGEKMSKSLGNFITVRHYLENRSAQSLRLLALNHHYRTPLNYTDPSAEQAEATLENVNLFLGKLAFAAKGAPRAGESLFLDDYGKEFDEALADDLNTPAALSGVFRAVNDANKKLWNLSGKAAKETARFIESRLKQMGFAFPKVIIPRQIVGLAKRREELRTNQQFIQSDALRKEIDALGYVIEDTPRGPFLWPKPTQRS